MANMKQKVGNRIDTAASKAKNTADKAIDKGKAKARSAGDSLKKQGDKLKNAGRQ